MNKVLIHVECLQGTGEITQARDLALKLQQNGAKCVIASGSSSKYLERFSDSRITLPEMYFVRSEGKYYIKDENGESHPLYKKNGGYSEKAQQLLEERKTLLLSALDDGVDTVISASGWPLWLGKGLLDNEMTALADKAESQETPFQVVTREITHADSPQLKGKNKEVIDFFKASPLRQWIVLGCEKTVPIFRSFPYATALKNGQITHAGYGFSSSQNTQPATSEKVLVSAGGGDLRQESYNILSIAMQAREKTGTLKDKPWHFIISNNVPEHQQQRRDKLIELARSINQRNGDDGITNGIIVHDVMKKEEYQGLLSQGPVLISQCGIGTIKDIFQYRLRSLVIPIEEPIKQSTLSGGTQEHIFREQAVRANELSKKNLLKTLESKAIVPGDGHTHNPSQIQMFAQAVDNIERQQPPNLSGITCDGLDTACSHIMNGNRHDRDQQR